VSLTFGPEPISLYGAHDEEASNQDGKREHGLSRHSSCSALPIAHPR